MQFEEVQIIHILQASNTKANKLTRLTTSLTILDGESQNISVAERKLLSPLSEVLHESEKDYNVEIATKIIGDRHTSFLDFLSNRRLPGDLVKEGEVKAKSDKILCPQRTVV